MDANHWMSIISIRVPQIVLWILPVQDVKVRYGAKWALVTGASSGIGEEIANRLGKQGVNLVLVSDQDQPLTAVANRIQRECRVTTKTICADLCTDQSVQTIARETESLPINLVFNNAGYIVMEGFHQSDLQSKVNNLHCNAVAAVKITDVFYRRMVESKTKGAIFFTSSSVASCPSPNSAIYAASKSMLTSFAETLSIEARRFNIDVLAVQPGYVRTKIFDRLPNLYILKALAFISQDRSAVVDMMFKSVGRLHFVVVDSGPFAIVASIARSILGGNVMTFLISLITKYILIDMRKFNEPPSSSNSSISKNSSSDGDNRKKR
ncbi:hypothetical protein SAMD00019534_012470 [Acytostelium subglobosum LB1]|uniref:hypothetical protein n=1 Tax=Acytostelium subglobosum LB1 TaxID=1410327 RepID=UPI000644C913|nr:hypothetical protein SAMD00019534_012470 [Acytostelium subglobosum LB1]GAM18072.1 hypothetical protein SAMD00019534_012470 [Acytostelium subglobosum LB1]|eukprot:XP_012758668.1 hypothetical protein SAMD00019534_012470 [Acytostelium subglobosum LB1]